VQAQTQSPAPSVEALGETDETAPRTDFSEKKGTPRQGDRAELDRIIELYMAGAYKLCSAQLYRLLDRGNPDAFKDPAVVETGRLYFASCSLLDGHRDEARRALRMALEENPLMRSPDSLTFPPPVVSLFLEVRDEVQQLIADREKEQVLELRRENERARRESELREYREQELLKLAREESVIAVNSRVVASVPFGLGQYQNGDTTLGTVVLVTEGLLLGTALTSAIVLEQLTRKNGEDIEPNRYNDQTLAAYRTMTWSTWALLGACALGITEAHLSFQKERRIGTRRRPLPSDLHPESMNETTSSEGPTVQPSFSAGPTGGHIGVFGTF
jgi:hypothetical protein